MRNRSFIVVAAVLAVLLIGAVGVYAYDRAGRDTIPKGVTVAGVPVGGLSESEAKAKLQREFVSRLRETITVHHGALTFHLSARTSKVAADLGGMVDEALAQSRRGNIFGRTLRRLSGGRLHVDVPARTTYDKKAALALVDRVRKAVERKPQNADVSFSAAGLHEVPGKVGLAVLAHELHQQVNRAIVDPNASHSLIARTRHVKPAVTTADLAKEYGTALIIDRSHFQLRLYQQLKLTKTYPIAVGMIGLETPAGLYHIQNKAINPAWTKPNSDWIPEGERGEVVPGGAAGNPLKARWLGIFAGAGIHGIDPSEYGTIGHAASHGCVRMRIPDVEDLYPKVPVGAPVYIA
jgi:lipoprotein-anchoring transpeptidase ErfK/SrfK